MAYTTINKSSEHFNTKLYTGNGSTQSITGVGFQPDFTWLKRRNGTAYHWVMDAIRGSTKVVYPNGTEAEQTQSQGITSFNSDGFTLGTNSDVNANNDTYASWNWKANGAGVTNTDGTITSTVSANTTSGFSIVSYTGNDVDNTKVGHGLGVAPSVMIFKSRSLSGRNWSTYHKDVPITKIMFLNTNNDATTTSSRFNDTAPTSSLINLGTNGDVNDSGVTYIAYCFAEKTGFSKFGKYIGTGSTTATPFIYTGFKPAFVMTKGVDVADQWTISDIPRDNAVGGGGNGTGARLTADSTSAESTNTSWASIQKYSNGFSPQGNDGVTNGTGSTYIYMAFAEAPLVGSNNVPCTAR